jgi:hypothetical protein
MVDLGLKSDNGGMTIFGRTMTTLDTGAYDGSPAYFFEVVAQNTSGAPYAVSLYDVNDSINPVASVTIPAATTYTKRVRASWTPNSGANTYQVAIAQTGAVGDVIVYSARMLVQQTSATKTKIYIPLISGGSLDSSFKDYEDGHVVHAKIPAAYDNMYDTAWTGALLPSPLWKKQSTNFASLAAGAPWTFEVVGGARNGTSLVYFALYNESTGNVVAGSEVSTNDPTTQSVLLSASLANNAANFSDGDSFSVRWKSAGDGVELGHAGLWVTLTSLSKGEVYYRVGNTFELHAFADTFFMHAQRALVDLSAYSNPVAYLEASGETAAGAGNTVSLYDDGTNDSSTVTVNDSLGGGGNLSGATLVAGSTLTLPIVNAAYLRSPAITLTTNHRYFAVFGYDGVNTTSMTRGALVISFH